MSGNITSNEDFKDIPHLNLDQNAIGSIDFEENPVFDYNCNTHIEEDEDNTSLNNEGWEQEHDKTGESSEMAAVSTSAKVFMCKLQSIIDSKNKEAANKFALPGAKSKSK